MTEIPSGIEGTEIVPGLMTESSLAALVEAGILVGGIGLMVLGFRFMFKNIIPNLVE